MAVLKYCDYTVSFPIPGLNTQVYQFFYLIGTDEYDLETPDGNPIAIDNNTGLFAWWTAISKGASFSYIENDTFFLVLKGCKYNLERIAISYHDSQGQPQWVYYDMIQSNCVFDFDVNVSRGCIDADANNFSELATEDDGSCSYDPISTQDLFIKKVNEYNLRIVRNKRMGDDEACCNDVKTDYLNYVAYLAKKIYGREVELSPAISATSTLDFSTFDINKLFDGMLINARIRYLDGSLELLTSYNGYYYGDSSVENLLIELSNRINIDSDGFSADANPAGGILNLIAPSDRGNSLNGATIEIVLPDEYKFTTVISFFDTDASLGYPTADTVYNTYFPSRGSTDVGRLRKLLNSTTDSDLLNCHTIDNGIGNSSVYMPATDYEGYGYPTHDIFSKNNAHFIIINDPGAWNHDYIYSFFNVAGGLIYVYKPDGTFDHPISVGFALTNGVMCYNPASKLLMVFCVSAGRRILVNYSSPSVPVILSVTADITQVMSENTAVYNPVNGCIYFSSNGSQITKYNGAGAVIVNIPHNLGNGILTVNPYTGHVYVTCTYSYVGGSGGYDVIDLLDNLTSSSLLGTLVGTIGVVKGSNNANTFFISALEDDTNLVKATTNSSTGLLTLVTYINFPVYAVNYSWPKAVYHDNYNNRTIVLISASPAVYSGTVTDAAILLPTGLVGQVLMIKASGSGISNCFGSTSVGHVYYYNTYKQCLSKLIYSSLTTNVIGKIAVSSGKYIRFYDVLSDQSIVCSSFMFEFFFATATDVTITHMLYKADTSDLIVFANSGTVNRIVFILNMLTFGTGHWTSSSTYWTTKPYLLSGSAISPSYGIYMPLTGDVILLQGIATPPDNNIRYIPANKGVNGLITTGSSSNVVSIASSIAGALFVMYADGKVETFSSVYASLGSFVLPSTLVYLSTYSIYDETLKLLIIVDATTGNVFLCNPISYLWIKTININTILLGATISKLISNDVGIVQIEYMLGTRVGVVLLELVDSENFNVTSLFSGGIDAISALDEDECITFEEMDEMMDVALQTIKKC